MARQPRHISRPTPDPDGQRPVGEIPPEHAITRLYVLPAGAAAEFLADLEDETEEPTFALRALLRGARD